MTIEMINASPKSIKTSLISSVIPDHRMEKANTANIINDASMHVSLRIFFILSLF